jgi:carboxyl-terminal processing protease
MTLTAESARALTNRIVHLLQTKCISLNGSDVDWGRLFSNAHSELEACTSAAEFERTVSRVLEGGGLSHVAFFGSNGQHVPARYAVCATFAEVDTSDGPLWMFQDVHEGGPAHQAGAQPGDVLLAIDGTPAKPPAPPRFHLGQDAVVTVRRVEGPDRQLTVTLPKPDPRKNGKGTPPMAVPTAVTSRMLEDGVGYVRVAFFPGASGQPFAGEFDRAVAALGPSCDRLIVDLRGNLGGFVGALRLMSYLTPDRMPVGYSLTRHGRANGRRPEQLPALDRLPESTIDKLAMLYRFKIRHRDRSVRLVTEGLGPKPFHGRIVLLVNEHTASAAEMVAGFASERQLATLVGMRTSGQVLGGANFAVGHNFTLRLPAAAWHMWDNRPLEGVGVVPNITISLDPRRLADGVDTQLTAAVRIALGLTVKNTAAAHIAVGADTT